MYTIDNEAAGGTLKPGVPGDFFSKTIYLIFYCMFTVHLHTNVSNSLPTDALFYFIVYSQHYTIK